MLTKEEKDLILKVCYSSLLYGITVYVENDTFYDEREPYKAKISIKSHQILDDFGNNPLSSKLLVRPYLRSMESMTEEEYREFGYDVLRYTSREFDWLIAHHFDIYGLIEKGLALEATKGMYK